MLAVAAGAWALFGRDKHSTTTAIGPKVPTSAPANPVFGPVAPGTTRKPVPAGPVTTKPTSLGPVAASKPAATTAPKPTPTKAVVRTPAPAAPTVPVATKAPTTPPVTTAPGVSGPQRAGTVAKKAYTFKVARGDTLWGLAKSTLSSTGRSTSNASVAAYVQKLYQHNSGVIGDDPNLIRVGQILTWPAGL